jgi:hypothetical protein
MCLRASSLTYPACTAHPPHYLRPLWSRHIFQNVLINGTVSGRMFLDTECVVLFSVQRIFETFLILGRIPPDIVINVKRLGVKYPLFLSDFNET